MTKFWLNIIGTLIALAISANVACLFNFNARLARIEAILQIRTGTIVAAP